MGVPQGHQAEFHPSRQACGECLCRELQRQATRRVFEHQLVHEREACQGDHRGLAGGLQRGQAPQLVERQIAEGVC